MRLGDKIGAAFAVYGLIFAAVLGIAVTVAFYAAEDAILDRFLTQAVTQVQDTANPDDVGPLPRGVTLFTSVVPRNLQDLPEGKYEIEQYRHVAVFRHDRTGRLLFLELDATTAGLDSVLSRILFGTLVVLVVTVVAGLLISRVVSAQLMRPMNELVDRIDQIDIPNPSLEPLRLDDEIGFLSERFAATVRLLGERDRRERDFTRFASHELRTPITVLGGTAAILRSEAALTERGQRALKRAELSIDRMSRLVDTFLFLGRSDFTLEFSELSEQRIAAEIRKFVADFADPGFDVQIEFGGNNGLFRSDAQLLSIVLENLVQNAVRHGTSELLVTISAPTIVLRNPVAEERRPHHGFGLEIAGRICERLSVDLVTSQSGGYFSARLGFPADADSPN